MIPLSRAEVTGPWSWLKWAIVGNDDDGPDGTRIPRNLWRPGIEGNLGAFWRLNPFHNLFFKVWGRPRGAVRYLIGRHEYSTIILRLDPFFLALGPLFIGWRLDKPLFPAPAHWTQYPAGWCAWDWGAKNRN